MGRGAGTQSRRFCGLRKRGPTDGEAGRRAGGGPDAAGGICGSVRPPGQPSLGWRLAGLLIESGRRALRRCDESWVWQAGPTALPEGPPPFPTLDGPFLRPRQRPVHLWAGQEASGKHPAPCPLRGGPLRGSSCPGGDEGCCFPAPLAGQVCLSLTPGVQPRGALPDLLSARSLALPSSRRLLPFSQGSRDLCVSRESLTRSPSRGCGNCRVVSRADRRRGGGAVFRGPPALQSAAPGAPE